VRVSVQQDRRRKDPSALSEFLTMLVIAVRNRYKLLGRPLLVARVRLVRRVFRRLLCQHSCYWWLRTGNWNVGSTSGRRAASWRRPLAQLVRCFMVRRSLLTYFGGYGSSGGYSLGWWNISGHLGSSGSTLLFGSAGGDVCGATADVARLGPWLVRLQLTGTGGTCGRFGTLSSTWFTGCGLLGRGWSGCSLGDLYCGHNNR